MANSFYGIRECRIVMRQTEFDLFVLIDNPTDFLPVGGWYCKTVAPADGKAYFEDAARALETAMRSQAYLTLDDGWTKEAPDENTQWQQDEIKRVRDANMELSMEVARLRLGVTDRAQ